MRNYITIFIIMLSCVGSRAQMPDTTAISTQKKMLGLRLAEIKDHTEAARTGIRDLKTGYKLRNKDSAFNNQLTAFSKELQHWKDNYGIWKKENDKYAQEKERFDREMLGYYRTKPFFRYRNRARTNQLAGVAMVTTGGVVFLGGLIKAMTELPVRSAAAAAERHDSNQRIMAACMAAGGILALSSVPFFKAAHKNRAIYKNHIVWNVNLIPARLPNGLTKDAWALQAYIPLFEH